MKHIYASSSLEIRQNPETVPSEEELLLPDGKSIGELIDESKQEQEAQRKDDSQQGNRETFP